MDLTNDFPEMVAIRKKREAWNQRAKVCGCGFRGVLFKGLPDILNSLIHFFHTDFVIQGLAVTAKMDCVLDMGCGYGRISAEIMANYPSTSIYGVDSSWEFITRYRRFLGKKAQAIGADALSLPFKSETFQAVVVVTCLMYLPSTFRQRALEEIFRVTRRGGIIILIEPGLLAQKIFSIGRFKARNTVNGLGTGGTGFALRNLKRCIADNGGVILDEKGNLGFTIGLLPLLLATKVSKEICLKMLVRFTGGFDKLFGKFPQFSMYFGLIVKKGLSN